VNPARLQEGFNTTITVEARNEVASSTVSVNVNVTDPTGASRVKSLDITTNGTGFGSNTTQYWSNFAGGANTSYVGLYLISVNGTLASGNFTVGLTDKLQYKRTETVSIRAVGYLPSENVTINLKLNDVSVTGFPKFKIANANGIVADTWAIPSDATPGNYQVSLTSTASQTVKAPVDTDTFTVLGAICSIKTVNLSNQTVASVTVEVYNATTNNYLGISSVTNSSGWAQVSLNRGNFTFKAFVNDVEVGNLSNLSVTVDNTFTIRLRLVNLTAFVETEVGDGVPFIDISLKYNYTTRDKEILPATLSLQTNPAGVAERQNIFTNITYTVEARRYGALFNSTILTVEFLPASPLITLHFKLPNYWLNVHALDSRNQNASQIQIQVYEWSSGIVNATKTLETNSSGDASFFLPFGKYRLRAYRNDLFLSETVVDLIKTPLTFVLNLNTLNLKVTVLILDNFGQPIANAEVKIERQNDQESVPVSKFTDASGSAVFDLPAGGDSLISVYIAGSPAAVKGQFIDNNSNRITFRLGEYVAVIGYPISTGLFALLAFILILAVSSLIIMTRKQLARVFAEKMPHLSRKSLLHTSF
jgi:hypothetical protein